MSHYLLMRFPYVILGRGVLPLVLSCVYSQVVQCDLCDDEVRCCCVSIGVSIEVPMHCGLGYLCVIFYLFVLSLCGALAPSGFEVSVGMGRCVRHLLIGANGG